MVYLIKKLNPYGLAPYGLAPYGLAIVMIIMGKFFYSLNDALVKWLSPHYPVHQIVLSRAVIAVILILWLIYASKSFSSLKKNFSWLYVFYALSALITNICFFIAISVIPLGQATALFFTAPMMIALFSFIFLHEKVDFRVVMAIFLGSGGVAMMFYPHWDQFNIALLLPLIAALAYALRQIITRKLRQKNSAAFMLLLIQCALILSGLMFSIILGNGRFLPKENSSEILDFLLRAWIFPHNYDMILFFLCGVFHALGGYFSILAYRLYQANVIAPMEYTTLIFAVLWGAIFWGEWPVLLDFIAMGMIVVGGIMLIARPHLKKIDDMCSELHRE